MIKAEHQHRVGVGENPFVDQLLVTCLVDTLKHRDRMSGNLANDMLEIECGTMKQFERPCDTLQEIRRSHSVVSNLGQATRRTSVIVENRLSISDSSRFDSHG